MKNSRNLMCTQHTRLGYHPHFRKHTLGIHTSMTVCVCVKTHKANLPASETGGESMGLAPSARRGGPNEKVCHISSSTLVRMCSFGAAIAAESVCVVRWPIMRLLCKPC